MLTKSLHTITAATNVARMLCRYHQKPGYYQHGLGAENLAADALCWLGYADSVAEWYAVASDSLRAERIAADPTITRIVTACAKVLAEERNSAKAAA